MAPIPSRGVVAVTGAAGFLGGWTVRKLIDRGYRVRACVRTTADPARCDFLRALPAYASGRLTLYSADLDRAGCFDEIFKGCQGVAHIAPVGDFDDHDYVLRTCDHIVASVNGSGSVSRVVVTSSVGAVISEIFHEDRHPGELNPKRTPERGQGYSMGKLLAERAFIDAADASGAWDAITLCPGDAVGPILSPHQKNVGPWQSLIRDMLEGVCKQSGVYRPWMTVDVRDAALCHVRLLESAQVKNGERYVAWSTDKRNVEDICADIARLLPELGYAAAPVIDPQPDRIKARETELRAVWGLADLRNDRIRAATGVTFRPLDDSIRDCVESLVALGGVRLGPASRFETHRVHAGAAITPEPMTALKRGEM